MTSTDPHEFAEGAVRELVRNCIDRSANDLDKAGRANMKVPALKVEGRAQVALAAQLRAEAKRTGWLG